MEELKKKFQVNPDKADGLIEEMVSQTITEIEYEVFNYPPWRRLNWGQMKQAWKFLAYHTIFRLKLFVIVVY